MIIHLMGLKVSNMVTDHLHFILAITYVNKWVLTNDVTLILQDYFSG